MTNEKDKSAGYDLAIDWTQSLSGDGIETDEIAHLGARIADLLATVRAEEREAAFKAIRERVEATNPKLTFGSANGDVMKKCILMEIADLEGSTYERTVENETA